MISIVIPIYNAELYLERCIESVISQKDMDWEMILIDDGSKDNSSEICKELCETNSRIKYIYQENRGPSAARNRGIQEAKGQYLMFLDADDYWEDNLLEIVVPRLGESDLLCFNYYRYSQRTRKKCDSVAGGLKSKEQFLLECNDNLNTVYYNKIYNKVYKTDIIRLNAIAFREELSMGEDLIFNLAYFTSCKTFLFLTDYLYNYRVDNTNSLMHTYFDDNTIERTVFLLKKVEEYFGLNHIPCYEITRGFNHYVTDSLLTLSTSFCRNQSMLSTVSVCNKILRVYAEQFNKLEYEGIKYKVWLKLAWNTKSGLLLSLRNKLIMLRYKIIMRIKGSRR